MTTRNHPPLRAMVGALLLAACTSHVLASQAARAELKSYTFTVADLPAPGTSGPNPPKVVPKPADATLTLPPGFRADIFASGMKRPRLAIEGPGGDVFVSDPSTGSVFVLHDRDGNHRIDDSERFEFATGITQPFGMAFHGTDLYVAATNAVLRFTCTPGQRKAAGPPATITSLPSGPTGHWTRNIRFSPDGAWLYVTVGSSSNADIDPDPLRAAVLRFKPDGSGRELVVTGARNPIGLAFHPRTRELWMTVQERDGMGDELVPDFVTRVTPGAFFGWPYAYIGPHEDPRHAGKRPDLVKAAVVPDVLLQSHSAAMEMTFYDGTRFPAKYRNGAFVALRGSSNRSKRTGYKVVFLPFTETGAPRGDYEDFIVGWMLGEDSPEVWGRPVGVAVLEDGSMLVTDDAAGTIWRVTYTDTAPAR